MSLTPETRVILTDALKPPADFTLETAVGTTYSLDLTAFLLAPMSFAMFEYTGGDVLEPADPIRLLEAVRRYAERTTVFCQAGAIHIPQQYRTILTFAEDSVHEVATGADSDIPGVFHPKVWALRFVNDDDGAYKHRLVVLSRNLTFDKSWDTALVLDEHDGGNISALPAADFLRKLPSLAAAPLPQNRLQDIRSVAETLSRVTLMAPSPFTSGELYGLGVAGHPWPFPKSAKQLLAISPFLTAGQISRLPETDIAPVLISRPEELDRLDSETLQHWESFVLENLEDHELDANMPDTDQDFSQKSRTDSLHAKTFVIDLHDRTSTTITGSANLTNAGWNKNVEFVAALHGKTRDCGVESVLVGKPGVPGLNSVLVGYTPSDELADTQAEDLAFEIEQFHHRLAAARATINVTRLDEKQVRSTLTFERAIAPFGETAVWPISLSHEINRKPLTEEVSWTHSPDHITAFIAFSTTIEQDGKRVSRQFALKAALEGDIPDRRHDVVLNTLKNKEGLLRYLVFLLGDPTYEALVAQLQATESEHGSREGQRVDSSDIVVLEPLIRAIGRDSEKLGQVASLIDELEGSPEGKELIPQDLAALWQLVWSVHEERAR